MKLFNSKEDSPYLSKRQWTKVFVAFSIMVLCLYIVAAICSLCGSKYFILNYQNSQMDKIESALRELQIYPMSMWFFTTFEYGIILSFVLKRFARIYYVVPFYFIAVILAFAFPPLSNTPFYQIYPFAFYIVVPIIEQFIRNRSLNKKEYLFSLLRLLIAMLVVFVLQILIFIIKAGYFTLESTIMNLSATFVYAIEYDIALSVILFTILLVYREKGDSKLWVTYQVVGSSSQTSKKQSQKSSLKKNLTKTQISKIRWLYVKFYLTQTCAFLFLMVIPFIVGKVFEFLVLYLSFAISRLLLGFKYSLHYKKETTCITVGVVVFGILSLAVPFFYVVLISAIVIGCSLAILLHLSYKYKGMWLFSSVSKPDKFALLYVYFDGNLDKNYVKARCKIKGLDKFKTDLIVEFVSGEKLSYMAKIHNYSQRMLIYKLDEAIDELIK